MANTFRSFLEKLGLVAPQKVTEPAIPSASVNIPEAPAAAMHVAEEVAPAASEAPVMMQTAADPLEDVAPAGPTACNSEHTNCTGMQKGCCELPAGHTDMHHQCNSCKQAF